MGYFDEPVSSASSPLTMESVNKMMKSVYEKQIFPTITIVGPTQYKSLVYFHERVRQDPMWNRIGADILPWIPGTQRRARRLRRRARQALGSFLLDHGIIEVPDGWEW